MSKVEQQDNTTVAHEAAARASTVRTGTFRIGLTGGIGSGKSTVADEFVRLGAHLVDTDVIAHSLTAPGGSAISAIRDSFGDAMIAADGSLERAAMRAHVFAQPQARKRLEEILHPMIRSQSEREAAAAVTDGAPYIILAIPLLIESGGGRDRFDRVLVVDCTIEVQIERVMSRSGLTREAVEAIIAVQATRQQRLDGADDVIDNSGDLQHLTAQVARLHDQYMTRTDALRNSGPPSFRPH